MNAMRHLSCLDYNTLSPSAENFFHDTKIVFHDTIIYFHDVIIYFHAVKITSGQEGMPLLSFHKRI